MAARMAIRGRSGQDDDDWEERARAGAAPLPASLRMPENAVEAVDRHAPPCRSPIHTHIMLGDQRLQVRHPSDTDAAFRIGHFRTTLAEILARDRLLPQRMVRDNFGLRTLVKIGTRDSNIHGVLFSAEVRELLGGVSIPNMPEKVVIKLCPYEVRRSGAGMFSASGASHRPGTLAFQDPCDPTNIEKQALMLMRDLIVRNVCPNLVMLHQHFVVDNFTALESPVTAAKNHLDGMRRRLWSMPPQIRPQAMVLIVEHCALGSMARWRSRTVRSTDRLRTSRSENEWRTVIFQVVYTLAVLNRAIPGFLHLDMHHGNVLIDHVKPAHPDRFFHYQFEDQDFYVPCLGPVPKIFDFDWCYAPGVLVNGKVKRGGPRVDVDNNRQDLHTFLNSTHCTHRHNALPEGVVEFIASLYRPGYLGENGDHVRDCRLIHGTPWEHLPTAESTLRHPWFECLRAAPAQASAIVHPQYRFGGDADE